MNKKIIIGVIVIFAAAVIWFINQGSESEPASIQPAATKNQPAQDANNTENETMFPEIQGEVKEFIIVGANFKFSLDEIRVAQGDTVRLIFKNGGGTHNWKIDEFNAATQIIQTGQEETIEFVADRAGEFEYYCSVGGHRKLGMKGMLIVE